MIVWKMLKGERSVVCECDLWIGDVTGMGVFVLEIYVRTVYRVYTGSVCQGIYVGFPGLYIDNDRFGLLNPGMMWYAQGDRGIEWPNL